VTHLRRMMLEELQRRNYAKSTVKTYLRIIQEFASHFHQRPDKLGPQHLREYQAYLLYFCSAEISERGFTRCCVATHSRSTLR
jgi:hypothetical protein